MEIIRQHMHISRLFIVGTLLSVRCAEV